MLQKNVKLIRKIKDAKKWIQYLHNNFNELKVIS